MARIHRTIQKNVLMIQITMMVLSDILGCELKWVFGSIPMNKASGGDGIPAELFQTLKDVMLKSYTHYASIFGKLSSGHTTGKGQFFHSNPKEK